ncbi:hypothetical protein [Haloprofundus salilacus]|uniref:hypothetical protein n=1 Tax=Haloprofundus salilacus TaxID=2876190 RepID=UPI001CCAF423|nr:hypothetical protein [Haloprofundus salilacus]
MSEDRPDGVGRNGEGERNDHDGGVDRLDARSDDEPDPFDELPTYDADAADPWESLESAVDDGVGGDGTTGADTFDASVVDEWADAVAEGDAALDAPNADTTPAVEADEGETYVVSKRHYCQTCPHFESPPEFGCSHEGTDIVETVGFERFRVRNCPIVDDESSAGTSRRSAHAVADASGDGSARHDDGRRDGSDRNGSD